MAWTGALDQRGGGRLDLILRFSCVKAFTPIPPLTPVSCRSDVGCDKIDAMPTAARRTFWALMGQAKTRPNPEVLMAG
eukprot:scaffold13108_cov55-Phaeocystis_antarctica.AAC.5